MYAVIEFGSHQFKVSEGDVINAMRVDAESGQTLDLDKVLVLGTGADIKVGKPYVAGAKVSVKVLRHFEGEKVIAFKYRKRKDSAKTIGSRLKLSALSITKIAG
jgi:large subunit ribosomal protein L21